MASKRILNSFVRCCLGRIGPTPETKWLKLGSIDCARACVSVCGHNYPPSVHWHRNPATYKMQSNVSKSSRRTLDHRIFVRMYINRARLKNARNQNIKKLFGKNGKAIALSLPLLARFIRPSVSKSKSILKKHSSVCEKPFQLNTARALSIFQAHSKII